MATEHREPGQDGPATVEDLEALPVFPGLRQELIGGEIVVTPPPRYWHQRVCTQLGVRMYARCEAVGLEVANGVGVMLADVDEVIIPDLVVVRAGSELIRDIYVNPADLVLAGEVVSFSTRRRDRSEKAAILARWGVPFYLIVDPFVEHIAIALCQLHAGAYEEIARVKAGTPLHLPAPFDFDLDTSKLG